WRQIDNELLALTDVLVVNANEAALMFDQSDLEKLTSQDWSEQLPKLARQLDWMGRLLVVTLAETGCVALDEVGQVVSRPAYPIQQVDATGAGDAFGSGLVWSLLRGLSLTEALRVGNACGALIAAREGILDGLPRRATVDTLMAAAAVPG
ncbi:MAG TPA: PfkB family carbohydrate kinase, partial [Candidatus Competibacter sp.]|nr:PfkB family carbohydrate kinase [Candidatus Competibacter sp.]